MTKLNVRLQEILDNMKNNGDDFYSQLTWEENDKLNERGLEQALYSLTDNDQIKDFGEYESEIADHMQNNGKNVKLKSEFYSLPCKCRVLGSYWTIHFDNGIMVDEIFSEGDWELESADVLATLFDVEWDVAEEVAKEYKIESAFYSGYIQVQYGYMFNDVEEYLKEKMENEEDIAPILNLIEQTDNYDHVEFEDMKERLLEE